MLTSDLIKQLEATIEQYGDLPVVSHRYDEREKHHTYKEYGGCWRTYISSIETHLDTDDNVLPNMCEVVVIKSSQDDW